MQNLPEVFSFLLASIRTQFASLFSRKIKPKKWVAGGEWKKLLLWVFDGLHCGGGDRRGGGEHYSNKAETDMCCCPVLSPDVVALFPWQGWSLVALATVCEVKNSKFASLLPDYFWWLARWRVYIATLHTTGRQKTFFFFSYFTSHCPFVHPGVCLSVWLFYVLILCTYYVDYFVSLKSYSTCYF